jgi:hypothetical protein
MKNYLTTALKIIGGVAIAFMLSALPVFAARTDNTWQYGPTGSYLMTTQPTGLDILINGLNHYLNFGVFSGFGGYGFRDNGGTMEFKNSGGSWVAVGTGGTGGVGTVTSISGSGGSTGLTLTGGPITSSGTLTLGGTLAVGFGGTGTSTAPANLQFLMGSTTGANQYVTGNQPFGPLLLDANGNVTATLIPRLDYLSHLAGITLQQGELAFATDTDQFYIGDGTTAGGLLVNPFQASSTKIYYNGGTVGIGTSTPSAMLDVKPNSTSISGIVVHDHNPGAGDMFAGYDATNVKRFSVDYSGNVTAPSGFFLGGTGSQFQRNCSGSSDCIGLEGANGFTGLFWDATDGSESLKFRIADQDSPGNSVGTINAGGDLQMNGALNGAVVNALSTSATSTFADGINMTKGCYAINSVCIGAGGGGGSGTVNSGVFGQAAFYGANGTAVSGTTTLVIGTTTADANNVGIGTTSPYSMLSVAGQVVAKNFVATSTATSTFAGPVFMGPTLGTLSNASLVVDDNSIIPMQVYSNGVETAPFFQIDNANRTLINANSVIQAAPLAEFTIEHNFSTRFDPLLGTGNPANYPLFVQNVSSLNASTTGIGFSVSNSNATAGAAIVFNRTGASSMGELRFYNHQDTTLGNPLIQAMTISDSGTVGIGTTSPRARLDISGTNNGLIPLFQVSSVSSFATTTRFMVTSTGNVGVGTTSPYLPFAVAGSEVITGSSTASTYTATSTTASSTLPNLNTSFFTPSTVVAPNSALSDFNFNTAIPDAGANPKFSFGIYNLGQMVFGVSPREVAGTNVTEIVMGDTAAPSVRLWGQGVGGDMARLDIHATQVVIDGTLVPQSDVQFSRVLPDASSIATQNDSRQLQFQGTLWNGSSAQSRNAEIYNRASRTLQGVSYLAFQMQDINSVNNEWLSIENDNGFTGIGSTSPSATLSVKPVSGLSTSNIFTVSSSTNATLLTIKGNGNVGIGTTSPYSMLSVAGTVVGQNFVATSTTATSTFSNGINLDNKGCFSVLGTCMVSSPWKDNGATVSFLNDRALYVGPTSNGIVFDTLGGFTAGDVSGNADSTQFNIDTGADTFNFNNGDAHFTGTVRVDGNMATAIDLAVGTTSLANTAQFQGASAHSATKGTCFRAKAVGGNSYVFWWFDTSAVQHNQTATCSGAGTTTISYD